MNIPSLSDLSRCYSMNQSFFEQQTKQLLYFSLYESTQSRNSTLYPNLDQENRRGRAVSPSKCRIADGPRGLGQVGSQYLEN